MYDFSIKNVYIDELNDIVNKYDKTYRAVKMKSIDVKSSQVHTLPFMQKIMMDVLNLKLTIM